MQAQDVNTSSAGATRLKLGILILLLAYGLWLLVPLAAMMNAPRKAIATLTGTILVANKVLLLVVIAVMGKSGFEQLRRRVSGYLKGFVLTDTVTPLRHVIGLVMFCVPIISALLVPYIDAVFPGLRPNRWEARLLGDLLLVASFFVLGGNFWDKFAALFSRTARVIDAQAI